MFVFFHLITAALTFYSAAQCFLSCSLFVVISLTSEQGAMFATTVVLRYLGHNFQLEEIASLTLHPIYMPYLVSVYRVPLLCSSEAGRGEGGGR